MNILPKCIIITGRPGSGKTTLAKRLSEYLHMPALSRDGVKEGLVNTYGVRHDLLPTDTNLNASALFFAAVSLLLDGNVSVIAEAAFQHSVWEEAVRRWGSIASIRFLICATDPALCAERHLSRGLNDPDREFFRGDNRVKIFRETGQVLGPGEYEPPAFDLPTLRVSTTEGYLSSLESIRDFIINGEH